MYVLLSYPKFKAFTAAGAPASGYLVYTYEPGGTTALATYSERTLTTPNANPIVLDSVGECLIYVGQATKLVLKTSAGVTVWTQDYLGEQQANFVTGSGISTVATNNYVVTTTPAVAALSNNFMLIMTPDADNADTITSNTFSPTGTGPNDCTASGPYVGSTSGSIFTVQIDSSLELPPSAPTLVENVAAGVVTVGNHYVKITFVTATGETMPGTASSVLAAAGSKQIDVSAIPVGTSQVTARKVYMTEAGGTAYYLVDTISNNVATTYTINIADATLAGNDPAPTSDSTDPGPDTFKWRKDAGAWTSAVAITGAVQSLTEGVKVLFASTAGHVTDDYWSILVETPARVNLDTLGNLVVYKNKGGSVVALDGSDMKDGYPAQLILNEAMNAWTLINPATPTFSTTTIQAVRYRKNLTGAYDLLLADQGYVLSCIGTFTVTLLTCPEFANRFVYIHNVGTGVITVDAGTYSIFGNGDVVGSTSIALTAGTCIQINTNGIDWQILTITNSGLVMLDFGEITDADSLDITGLVPGVKYRLALNGALTDAAGGNAVPYLRFNADSDPTYQIAGYEIANATQTLSGGGAATNLALTYTSPDLSHFNAVIEFETKQGDDAWVFADMVVNYMLSTKLARSAQSGEYNGSADLSSASIEFTGMTISGKYVLYKYNSPI